MVSIDKPAARPRPGPVAWALYRVSPTMTVFHLSTRRRHPTEG